MSTKSFAFILRSRSACHLREGSRLELTPSEKSGAKIKRVLLQSEYFEGKPIRLRAYVECQGDSLEAVVSEIGTIIGADMHYLAVATNSMVSWPEFHVGCELGEPGQAGSYVEEAHPPSPPPPVGYRLIEPEQHLPVSEAIKTHNYKDTLCQIASVYAAALEHLDHRNNLFAAELAYIAAEHLARLILKKYEEEQHLPKKQIAIRFGISKDKARGNGLRDEIAIREIYDNDRELYERHKSMSEGFEHGFGVFGEIRSSSSEIVNKVLALVRASIIKQLGLEKRLEEELLSEAYRKPLAGWLPRVHLAGTWRPKCENFDIEAFLASQNLAQAENGAVCFSDFSLNVDKFQLKGGNNSPFPAEISYTEQLLGMPSDGRAKIAEVEVTDKSVKKRDDD